MPNYIKRCQLGTRILEFFLASTTMIVLCVICFGFITHTWDFRANPAFWILAGIAVFLIELALFWAGIIMVYVSSLQLGVRTRVKGLICGWIPLVNLAVLL